MKEKSKTELQNKITQLEIENSNLRKELECANALVHVKEGGIYSDEDGELYCAGIDELIQLPCGASYEHSSIKLVNYIGQLEDVVNTYQSG